MIAVEVGTPSQGVVVAALMLVSPILGYVMFRAARPHTEKIEDQNALAASMTAIGDAAVSVVTASTDVSELMQSMLAPLRADLTETRLMLAANDLEHARQIDSLRAEFVADQHECARKLSVLSSHVAMLRAKMRAAGVDPGPPPDLDGFTFD